LRARCEMTWLAAATVGSATHRRARGRRPRASTYRARCEMTWLAAGGTPAASAYYTRRLVMARKKRTPVSRPPEAESTPPSPVVPATRQTEEEAIRQAQDEGRAHHQITDRLPASSPESAGQGAETPPPLDQKPPAPLSFVEQIAWRAEQEAIDRAGDELRSRQPLPAQPGFPRRRRRRK